MVRRNVSERALRTCHWLFLKRYEGSKVEMTVYDRRTGRVRLVYHVRTPQDLERCKRAYLSKYRIPKEAVVESALTPAQYFESVEKVEVTSEVLSSPVKTEETSEGPVVVQRD
jgi:hypothetical protein